MLNASVSSASVRSERRTRSDVRIAAVRGNGRAVRGGNREQRVAAARAGRRQWHWRDDGGCGEFREPVQRRGHLNCARAMVRRRGRQRGDMRHWRSGRVARAARRRRRRRRGRRQGAAARARAAQTRAQRGRGVGRQRAGGGDGVQTQAATQPPYCLRHHYSQRRGATPSRRGRGADPPQMGRQHCCSQRTAAAQGCGAPRIRWHQACRWSAPAGDVAARACPRAHQ